MSVITLIIVLLLIGHGQSQPVANPSPIVDVSWPNCTLNLPPAQTGIVGLTYGRVFNINPCVDKELTKYQFPSLYVNTGYPGVAYRWKFQQGPKACPASDNLCLAYNYGYNAGEYDITYSVSHGLFGDRWWLDVETDNSWDTNPQVNRAALRGMLDAINSFVGKNHTGFYASVGQWDLLTGGWRNGYPAWVATGGTGEATAQKACSGPSFTGGPLLLAQYTPSLDQNLICN